MIMNEILTIFVPILDEAKKLTEIFILILLSEMHGAGRINYDWANTGCSNYLIIFKIIFYVRKHFSCDKTLCQY